MIGPIRLSSPIYLRTIPAVDRLIQQLDRKTQEVEIEARVISATRSFARDIGTQLGFGWGNSPTAVGGASAAGISPIVVGNTPAPTYIANGKQDKPFRFPLFSNLGVTGPTSGLSFVNATNSIRIDAVLDHGRIPWIAEDTFSAAGCYPEQYPSCRQAGCAGANRERCHSGFTGDDYLR